MTDKLELEHEPTTFIYSVIEYMDDVGRRVVHRKVVEGTAPADFSEYIGMNQLVLQVGGAAPAQQQISPYKFPIDGVRSLTEAFGRWDTCARTYGDMHVADLRRQYREAMAASQKLAVPTPDQAKKILLTDG